MAVDVLTYEPVLSYTDEPIEATEPAPAGTEVWLWRMKAARYLKVESARRNRMLLARDSTGNALYHLTPSGALKRTFPLSSSRRKFVLQRDNACVWCGSLDRLEVDHIVRYIDGGGNDADNLRALCHDCHASRGGRA